MQTYKSNLLLDPLSGGGGGAPNSPEAFTALLQTLPEDMRSDPNFASIKTFPDFAKSFVNAQKLIGVKRTALPDASWKPEQYADFYKTLGRPDQPDLYKPSDATKPRDGVVLDEARMKTVRENFHKMGLTQKQGQDLLDMYIGEMNQTHESLHSARQAQTQESTLALKEQWGDKYDANVDIAKSVLKKFDRDGEIVKLLDSTGLGNDPKIVGFFHEIGKLMLEDTSKGKGGGLQVLDSTRAGQQIEALKGDAEFMKALFTREHPGHQAALDKWTLLHQQVHPSEKKV